MLAGLITPSHAEEAPDFIFPKVESTVRDRLFLRLSYVYANVKTTSGDTYDVTGPVVSRGDIAAMTSSLFTDAAHGGDPVSDYYGVLGGQLDLAMTTDSAAQGCASLANGLGTPCGIKAKGSAAVGTPALSVGYYLDEDYRWVVEAFVLAAPLRVGVYGDGNNHLNGKKIIDVKMLPPMAVLGRYFGNKDAKIRPYAGFGASYAMFFDVRATSTLNDYVGGSSPGDTSVKLKNTFGWGPFLGVKAQLDDTWQVSLNVGQIRYKTSATLITNNTVITSNSAVLSDYGPSVTRAINTAAGLISPEVSSAGTPPGSSVGDSVGATTAIMCDLANAKYGNKSCNQGTFVRKQSTTLDATMVMFSVGHTF
jgi:outer membrane protein W